MSGSALKMLRNSLMAWNAMGTTRFLPRCFVMNSTNEAMLCAEPRVVRYLTKTGRTCMQSADRTCPRHHCCVDLHTEPEVDLHRRSDALRGTACSALLDENRTNLYAVSRPNMSTALLLRRPAHRARGSAVNRTREKSQKHTFTKGVILHILHILRILLYFAYPKMLCTRPTRCG
jgi:hypothetical protein